MLPDIINIKGYIWLGIDLNESTLGLFLTTTVETVSKLNLQELNLTVK